jgi:serine/threonine-protein kinase
MELLVGHELETEIDDTGGLEPGRAITLMKTCLDALAKGHVAGIVHKDLKPANLFLTHPNSPRENLVILDFGVARKNDPDNAKHKMTETGAFNGTPQYLSPEYIQDQIVTPALDVYQVGLILVEMLTGQVVVSNDNPYECIISHCTGDLKLPPSLMAGTLGPVLKKALALDPNDRYRDAAAFMSALDDVDPAAITLGSHPAGARLGAVTVAFGVVTQPDGDVTHASPQPEKTPLPGETPQAPPPAAQPGTTPRSRFAKPLAVAVAAFAVLAMAVVIAVAWSPDEPEVPEAAPIEEPAATEVVTPLSEPDPEPDDRFTPEETEEIRSGLDRTKRLIAMKQWGEAKKQANAILELDPQNSDAKSYLEDIDANGQKGTGERRGRRGFRPGSW